MLLRLGWHRHPVLTRAGWGLLAASALLLVRRAGAWGLAAGTTAAMLAALAVLAHAALTTPAPRHMPVERIPVPHRREAPDWPDLSRRLAIFLIVVILDLAASLLASWSVQRALFRSGASAADTTALALFLLPMLWLVLASWQMTQEGPRSMLPAPLALIGLGGAAWLIA